MGINLDEWWSSESQQQNKQNKQNKQQNKTKQKAKETGSEGATLHKLQVTNHNL